MSSYECLKSAYPDVIGTRASESLMSNIKVNRCLRVEINLYLSEHLSTSNSVTKKLKPPLRQTIDFEIRINFLVEIASLPHFPLLRFECFRHDKISEMENVSTLELDG